eukprot:TRINITY_DN1830_c0_g1_i7.p3 TRINITY_DN1830_c0_g1~~TRINITY_DN1830_c0_g1_i7.p3  ORF type:complete len:103 (-),score=17.56 TRINITY_DN1830_c0_g1_i7:395-703(-)
MLQATQSSEENTKLQNGENGMADSFEAYHYVKISSSFTANVWDIKVAVGDEVSVDDTVVILEAMKMESPISSHVSGKVVHIPISQGQLVHQGETLVIVSVEK